MLSHPAAVASEKAPGRGGAGRAPGRAGRRLHGLLALHRGAGEQLRRPRLAVSPVRGHRSPARQPDVFLPELRQRSGNVGCLLSLFGGLGGRLPELAAGHISVQALLLQHGHLSRGEGAARSLQTLLPAQPPAVLWESTLRPASLCPPWVLKTLCGDVSQTPSKVGPPPTVCSPGLTSFSEPFPTGPVPGTSLLPSLP